ncbi:MAG: hypothetical protein WCI64_07160 [Chlorobium sp.]
MHDGYLMQNSYSTADGFHVVTAWQWYFVQIGRMTGREPETNSQTNLNVYDVHDMYL